MSEGEFLRRMNEESEANDEHPTVSQHDCDVMCKWFKEQVEEAKQEYPVYTGTRKLSIEKTTQLALRQAIARHKWFEKWFGTAAEEKKSEP